MSELTLDAFCNTSSTDELCREWRDALERKRAAMEPAKLKDPSWVAKDNWPKSAA